MVVLSHGLYGACARNFVDKVNKFEADCATLRCRGVEEILVMSLPNVWKRDFVMGNAQVYNHHLISLILIVI